MPAKKTAAKQQKKPNTRIPILGHGETPSPMRFCQFIDQNATVDIAVQNTPGVYSEQGELLTLEVAGPREYTYYDPAGTTCAIVTCGGLCPGINDVIRSIVMEGHHNYKTASILGIPFGLEGFIPKYGHKIQKLTPASVSDIHLFGGTVLGSSRGPQPPGEIVDTLERLHITVVFFIGGDGTMRAAATVQQEVSRRKLNIAVIGIPKTIDNDISYVFRSFGFDTAVDVATQAIQCAHTEARGVFNGIGLVKLMGRESGFIAAQATVALKEVNFVLVPEVPIVLKGKNGLLAALKRRMLERHHAVIVLAEGAGQDLCQKTEQKDASGNRILGDIAGLLYEEIKIYFQKQNIPAFLKFIDPSYIIRSVPANSNDRVYCGFLGQHAVHAAMAGKTGVVISKMRGHYVHLPLELVTRGRRSIDICSDYWRSVLESTGQLYYMYGE